MTRSSYAPPVTASETIRFSCGCALVIEHEFDTHHVDCYIHPCGLPLCPVKHALIDSAITVYHDELVHTLRPHVTGPP